MQTCFTVLTELPVIILTILYVAIFDVSFVMLMRINY